MSIGHCAYADLVATDETTLLYSYCCYTLNEWERKSDRRDADGELIIDRSCFVEPEIHKKLKRMPSGKKKLVVKRVIVWDYDYPEWIRTKKIQIRNASGTWKTDANGCDFMAVSLLYKLLNTYQETGVIPSHVGYYK